MHRYVLEDTRHVPPFNEPASQLTIGVESLKVHQENLFARFFKDCELGATFHHPDEIRTIKPGEAIVYRDNLWFDQEFLDYFLARARKLQRACRAALSAEDKAFRTYALPLATGYETRTDREGKTYYLADLWYFPKGYTEEVMPVVVPGDPQEKGFYSVPDFMAQNNEDLTHYLPDRALLSIESWVHVYYASVIFGVSTRGSRFEEDMKKHNLKMLKLLWYGILEQKQVLTTSQAVKVGKDCYIDPSAVITGPTTIGNNCFVGPGTVIDNCSIGDRVSISQGCQLMLSTVADNCFLPFRASLFMTAMMENSIVAQNTCLQMCVVGRNSFVGAGNTCTDFNLVGEPDGRGGVRPRPIKAANIRGELENVGQVVLGSAIGHNCRIGSGMIVYPGRMIESDVVLVASPQRRVIARNVRYEESDHLALEVEGGAHHRQYPRLEDLEAEETTWSEW